MSDEPPAPKPIVGNKAIEDAAIAFVSERELAHGRKAKDMRYKGSAADLVSDDRVIEVKTVGGWLRSAGALLMEPRQVQEARRDPDHFYVYIVENVAQGDRSKFEVRVLHGDRLRQALDHAKQRSYYEVPIPLGEYRELPRL